MSMEGEPSGFIRITQLFLLSTAWGMQIWVTFIAGFVLFRTVSRHTFGLVQGKLFPFYFYTLLGCTFLNLAIFAAYHPRELLSTRETVQITLFFICLIWLPLMPPGSPKSPPRPCLRCKRLKGAWARTGSGKFRSTRGLPTSEGEGWQISAPAPEVLQVSWLVFSLCNLVCVICTGVNLAFIALQLESL